MATITWLHLSDLHFRPDERRRWDESIVLRALLSDVKERIASDGLRPDFIVVSGDVAFSGQPEEYALARQFFDDLLKVAGLPKTRLFIVPGNHDVSRKAISQGTRVIADSLDSRDKMAAVLADEHDRRSLLRKLDPYGRFLGEYFAGQLPFDDERYFHVRDLEVAGQKVAVLGLNSAWLSMGDTDYGRLALGERQVRGALEVVHDADLRIALLHHPFDWLWEFDRDDCEGLLLESCDFILHGHLHRAGLLTLQTPDATAMVIAAGASYETRQYPNGYNFVQLDPETRKGTIHLRTYSDRRGGFWTKDVQTYKNVKDGIHRFNWSSQSKDQATLGLAVPITPPASPAKLEVGYLRRVQMISNLLPLTLINPRAVDQVHQQTLDLLPLYVALNTRTPVPIEEEQVQAGKKGGRLAGLPDGEKPMQPLSALEAVARERLMVLLGDPGSGKSTFGSYLALCLAGGRLEQVGETAALPGDNWLAHLAPAWTHGPLLPVQIVLRQFAKSQWCNGTAVGLWHFIAETLTNQGLDDFAPYLRERLMDGGVLVLLDGLDEVADPDQRETVRDAVAEFVARYNHSTNRFLVTCRGYAYQDACCQLDRFSVHTLAPFSQEQIDAFIGCWYSEVCRQGWKSEEEAGRLTETLRAATRRPDLAPLAENPLQLAMMTSLQFSWGRLPDDRVELYQEMVKLLLVRWQEARLGQETGITQTTSVKELEAALARVAFVAHHSQAAAQGPADITEATLLSELKEALDSSYARAEQMVAYIQNRAGLLIDRGKGIYTFPHRSYQEYLAGAYLAVRPEFPDDAADLARKNYTQWREVVLWAVGIVARQGYIHTAVAVAAALCPHELAAEEITETDWRLASLAGEVLLEAGPKQVGRPPYKPTVDRVRQWLTAVMERGALAPRERVAAGRILGCLGDTRAAILTPERMEFCTIPAGPFVMGSGDDDTDAFSDERPQHTLAIPYDYWIGRYPVTNAQFLPFVAAGGYREPRYWKEAAASGRWRHGKIRRQEYYRDDRQQFKVRESGEGDAPEDYGEPFNLPNYPVVGITWYEALAYTRWLTEQLTDVLPAGWLARLPTEAEWERAARGGPAGNPLPRRRYPWGNEPDPAHANYADTGIGATSAVGCFPSGASPDRVLDMSGNVWEWTQSLWGKDLQTPDFQYPYRTDDGRENLAAHYDITRVVRGGAFYSYARGVRCAVRLGDLPSRCSRDIGFRVVCVSQHS